MTEETESMMAARSALQDLTASDPAVRANILRYVAALTLMLAGRKGQDRLDEEPHIIGTFAFAPGERMVQMKVVADTERDQILLLFDIDDAGGPPVGLTAIRDAGDKVAYHGECVLWSPANEGPALVVPLKDVEEGHLAFRKGKSLQYREGFPAKNLEAGVRRAARRMEQTAKSIAVDDIVPHGKVQVINSDGGGKLRVTITPLAE